MRTFAILPVKGFPSAKRRLGGKISGDDRQSLAEAMLRDVLVALQTSSSINEVLVVAGGEGPHQIANEQGVRVIRDQERGHSDAAQLGIDTALDAGAERALLVPGDCPMLDGAELDDLLARAVIPPSALIVPDRHGTGTNALVLTPPAALTPSFGPGSCQRHSAAARAAGVHVEVVEVPSLAIDVDTPQDLAALEAANCTGASETGQLLSRLTLSSAC